MFRTLLRPATIWVSIVVSFSASSAPLMAAAQANGNPWANTASVAQPRFYDEAQPLVRLAPQQAMQQPNVSPYAPADLERRLTLGQLPPQMTAPQIATPQAAMNGQAPTGYAPVTAGIPNVPGALPYTGMQPNNAYGGGYPAQGYGTAPYPQGYNNGFYPGGGYGVPNGYGGYPGVGGSGWPQWGNSPGNGSPFSGFSPFGFW